jgi:hypothetical protein
MVLIGGAGRPLGVRFPTGRFYPGGEFLPSEAFRVAIAPPEASRSPRRSSLPMPLTGSAMPTVQCQLDPP